MLSRFGAAQDIVVVQLHHHVEHAESVGFNGFLQQQILLNVNLDNDVSTGFDGFLSHDGHARFVTGLDVAVGLHDAGSPKVLLGLRRAVPVGPHCLGQVPDRTGSHAHDFVLGGLEET